MNVFVVTCGVSILEGMRQAALSDWARPAQGAPAREEPDDVRFVKGLLNERGTDGSVWRADQAALGRAYEGFNSWTRLPELDGDWEKVVDGWRGVAALHGLVDRGGALRLKDQDGAISAELASLAIGGDGAERPPRFQPQEDRLVLLTSDSVRGVVAAHLNAAHHAREIRFYVDPAAWREGDYRCSLGDRDSDAAWAEIVRVPELVAEDARKFARAARHLGSAFAYANEMAAGGRLILHATGGFKATIATLAGILECLPECRPDDAAHEAWCLYEASKVPMRLPMRRTRGAAAESLSEALHAVYDNHDPGYADWDGYLYVQNTPPVDGRRWSLTPLGEALHEVWDRQEGAVGA